MNRKYIDFVPKTKIESNEPVVKMPNPAEISLAADGSVRPVRRRGMADIMRPRRAVVTGASVEEVRHEVVETIDFDDEGNEFAAREKGESFGELESLTVEDIMVEDAPTKKGAKGEKKSESKRFGAKRPKMEDFALDEAVKDADDLDKTLKVPKMPGLGVLPKARFVNTEKVDKRPLSKNVYQKKVVAPKEEPQGPVTIIAKPEKDSKMGLIVTIVITIVLGAAAGTVAFLLLPK